MKYLHIIILLIILALGVVACGKQADAQNQEIPAPESVGNPVEGEATFKATHEDAPACSTCHAVQGDQTIVGPPLTHIATQAGNRVAGIDTVEYIRQSIIDPDAYVADGKDISIMYKHFGEKLTPEQVDNLVAYLLTLR